MSFVYANAGSAPGAGGIGWFDFGTIVMNPGDSLVGLGGTLSDGNTVTFDLSYALVSGLPRTFRSSPVPTIPGVGFGNLGYTGMGGRPSFYSDYNLAGAGINEFTVSNIVVKDAGGNVIPNYTVILADAETTNTGEVWRFRSNAGSWSLLTTLGSNPPTLAGVGTTDVTITGTTLFPQVSAADYVLTAQSPTQLFITSTETQSGRQAFALGFAVSKLTLQKYVGERIDSNDQFTLSIAGTPADSATTSGSSTGFQSATAAVWLTPGSPYVINESMAAGSGSLLTDYTVVTTASNSTPAGTVPPVGALPITFTPAVGDNVTYTILNAAPQTFSKRVDKAYADLGELLTYTVTINNPNSYAVNNVLMTDTTPAGTTYVGNLAVSAPYSGTSPATGITITTIAANSFVTISWQVQVNNALPITSPIANMAMVTVPGGNSGNSNVVTTQIRHADLKSQGNIIKTVDKAYASLGDTLTYTLTLRNTGNAAANNVVVTDSIPAGTSYVAGSVSSSVPFSGSPATGISLTGPIPAGGSATITFMVTVASSIPAVNPIPNTASTKYSYTVDPIKPNSVTDTGLSNTVNTLISTAKLVISKVVDKGIAYIGDLITYSFSIKNTGNAPANNVVLSDVIPNGAAYQAGSLVVSVPYTNVPPASILLTNAIAPGETVSISFVVKVTAMPNPNPLVNRGTADYSYTVNPNNPNGISKVATSNAVYTTVFRYNYSQQIADIINSVAYEEAALAAIIDAEGAKIQAIVAMGDATTLELLCLNKSVADMTESISMLESVLKQKLSTLNCQINGYCA